VPYVWRGTIKICRKKLKTKNRVLGYCTKSVNVLDGIIFAQQRKRTKNAVVFWLNMDSGEIWRNKRRLKQKRWESVSDVTLKDNSISWYGAQLKRYPTRHHQQTGHLTTRKEMFFILTNLYCSAPPWHYSYYGKSAHSVDVADWCDGTARVLSHWLVNPVMTN